MLSINPYVLSICDCLLQHLFMKNVFAFNSINTKLLHLYFILCKLERAQLLCVCLQGLTYNIYPSQGELSSTEEWVAMLK